MGERVHCRPFAISSVQFVALDAGSRTNTPTLALYFTAYFTGIVYIRGVNTYGYKQEDGYPTSSRKNPNLSLFTEPSKTSSAVVPSEGRSGNVE